eukprot:TRINITY_DN54746_c0_g1_i1.p1 TRINITY_DN54746_c0_g1~~TRINITY_DN54746_c0_g1_i1.p1  ORF type:complete len:295 (-),score=55.08 TRINITY_DN54746_c0_g1_i1:174-1058(-)
MSFAPVDSDGPRVYGHVSKQQPKQRKDEGSPYERSIKANIQELQENMHRADEQLERMQRGFVTKRSGESLEKCLERSRELVEETEQCFRDWTVALAGEPAERHRKRFSYQKLRKAFEEEMSHLKEVARQAVVVQQEANDKRAAPPAAVECYNICDDQSDMPDEESGLLTDMGGGAQGSHLLLNEEVAMQSSLARDREDGIRRIQSQVAEVNQIFRDLASIVSEQDQQFQSIETQAESASVATKDATRDLRKALDRQRSQRERLCCLLIACVVLLTVVVLPHMRGTDRLVKQPGA